MNKKWEIIPGGGWSWVWLWEAGSDLGFVAVLGPGWRAGVISSAQDVVPEGILSFSLRVLAFRTLKNLETPRGL